MIVLNPEPQKSKIGRDLAIGIISFLSPLLILAIWETLARLDLIDTRLFSSPTMVIQSLIPLISSNELFKHTAISVWRIFVGFAVGAGSGVLLGLSMGLFPIVRAALEPMVAATFPIPKLAIMPLILLVFGLGETSKVVIIAIGVFYLVLINTMTGVLSVDRIYLDVAKSFKASPINFYRTVALPGSLPMIFAGFKLGMGTALLLIVAAELSAARAGIGYMIWRAYDMFDIERMFVGLIVMSVLGYFFSYGLDLLEKIVIPWKSSK